VSYSPIDPATWDRSAASAFIIGIDVGMHADHSALVLAGVWPLAAATIGVVDIKQFALGTSFEEVADAVAAVVRANRARVIVDSSNNSAFVGTLAVRLPQPPANWLVAAAITSALAHSAQPTPFAITLGGQRSGVPRWTLSKSELIETVAAELGNGSLRFAKQGDWEILQTELSTMERTVRASGGASYSAPPGNHDDLVMALSLTVFGCRRFGRPALRHRFVRARVSAAGWT
jgi:hypothetical protein